MVFFCFCFFYLKTKNNETIKNELHFEYCHISGAGRRTVCRLSLGVLDFRKTNLWSDGYRRDLGDVAGLLSQPCSLTVHLVWRTMIDIS